MTKSATLLKGSPIKQVLLFFIPLLIGNAFQQLYTMTDAYIVGQTIGVDALASIGATVALVSLIIGFAQGISNGFTIKISQYCGAGDEEGVRRSFVTGCVLSVAISVVLTVVAVPFTRQMLLLLNTPAELLENAYVYLIIIFLGLIAAMMYNFFASAIRAMGDGRAPLIFLIISSVVSVILDYVLILYTNLGVAGAAISTVASQFLSAVLCLRYIFKNMPVMVKGASIKDITFESSTEHLGFGVPMGVQTFIISIGSLVLQTTLNGLGSTVVAAYTASGKIDLFTNLPLNSMGIAVGTFTAQNYGARQIHRIKKATIQSIVISTAYSLLMGLVMIFFGGSITAAFIGNTAPEVIETAKTYLLVSGTTYTFLGILFNTRYALQGLGMSAVPTFAGIMEMIMRCTASLLLVPLFGYVGTCFANPLAWIGAAVPLVIAFIKAMRRLTILYPEQQVVIELEAAHVNPHAEATETY